MPEKNKCGSTACLGGWMAIDPEHNARGFVRADLQINDIPTFRGYFGFTAMAAFWDVDRHSVSEIADPKFYDHKIWPFTMDITPEIVILRLEALVQKHEPAST